MVTKSGLSVKAGRQFEYAARNGDEIGTRTVSTCAAAKKKIRRQHMDAREHIPAGTM